MSTFKRTARMRVGGRGYGGPNRIRLPTPTPPSPPPQEWVDLTESEEEDPEELVPELSEDEPEEEPQEEPSEVQSPVPSSAPQQEQPQEDPECPAVDLEDPRQDPKDGDAPPSKMMRTTMKPDPWSPLPTAGSTTLRPFLGCRERRRRCSTTISFGSPMWGLATAIPSYTMIGI
ncbi:hypothetical protein U9M48_002214 [Paspalum notatum var. saurae]|uniref:Uncharacterized protein n=1 Tax=Paspalum notatum var. saurae TaxID=547442 RepID=A0AAQ3PQG1_PASNO